MSDNRQHWLDEEATLDERVNEALWPGGQKAVDRLAQQGKKPVRELIDALSIRAPCFLNCPGLPVSV